METSIDSSMITPLPQAWIEKALMMIKFLLKQNRTETIHQLVKVSFLVKCHSFNVETCCLFAGDQLPLHRKSQKIRLGLYFA